MRRATYLEKARSINRIVGIQTMLASPEKIRAWSHGEVTKPETINYRTFKPERDGLFCARIFGPVNDWECLCGKYKRMKYRGITCEKCGVEVIQSKVRRERNGHIELAAPVSHIWFLKGTPSRIPLLLGMKAKDVESVNYYEMWVVTDPGNVPVDELQAQFAYYRQFCEFQDPKRNDVAKTQERIEDNIYESLVQYVPPPTPLLHCAGKFESKLHLGLFSAEELDAAKSVRDLLDLPRQFHAHVLKESSKERGKAKDDREPKNPFALMQFFREVLGAIREKGLFGTLDNKVERKDVIAFLAQKAKSKELLVSFLRDEHGLDLRSAAEVGKDIDGGDGPYSRLFSILLEKPEERRALLNGYRRTLIDTRNGHLIEFRKKLEGYLAHFPKDEEGTSEKRLPSDAAVETLSDALHDLFRRETSQKDQDKAFKENFGRLPWKKGMDHKDRANLMAELFDRETYLVERYEQILAMKEEFLTPPGDDMEGQFFLRYKALLQDKVREVFRGVKDLQGVGVHIGAAGVQELMKHLDQECCCPNCDSERKPLSRMECLAKLLRGYVKTLPSSQKRTNLNKRLKLLEAFQRSGNKPEWMILTVLPVTPPELRPLVPLDGGRFATSDLNDLYRRVINRNNRLRKLNEMRAPEVIIRNEKRMLQEAVDALFDNGRRGRPIKGTGNRPLKSLSDTLKGKQGRFRQNLLGKRVDYSGRSVIVVGPELKLHQCGLPKLMALELFKPFIYNKLEERGLAPTIKQAKEMADAGAPEVWDILEEVIQSHPVLLNRAPTLHRLGIQAFEPVLVEGKAIKLHPLVCTAFNADFDGDQMAVHVPLSPASQVEAHVLMLSTNNLLYPANGNPIIVPTQDMVLGVFYLTHHMEGSRGEGKVFGSTDEVVMAYANGWVELHARVKVRYTGMVRFPDAFATQAGPVDEQDISHAPERELKRELLETTVGRVIFSASLPPGVPFINSHLRKKGLKDLFNFLYQNFGREVLVAAADSTKETGFLYATKAGISFGMDDMVVPPKKKQILEAAEAEVDKIDRNLRDGAITSLERRNKIVDIWNKATDDVAKAMDDTLREDEKRSKQFNPIVLMADSGARGSRQQLRQLAGMRGLMAKPSGEIIEQPITANFREGLNVLQYFVSSHGARKGLADTALKTADSGYLTRRLVDVAQDVIISEDDCNTLDGIFVTPLMEGGRVMEPIRDRVVGRVTLENVVDTFTGEVIIRENEEIDEATAQKIQDAGIERVKIRSVLTCETRRGVCARCYGRNLATGQLVELGEAIGVMAAQSIGEPGTQLTMRTFHVGGTASAEKMENEHKAHYTGTAKFHNIKWIEDKTSPEEDGRYGLIAMNRGGTLVILDDSGRERGKVPVVYGAQIKVREGDRIKKGKLLVQWDPYTNPILSDVDGEVHFRDIVDGVTITEETDPTTGFTQRVVIDSKDSTKEARIVVREAGKKSGGKQVPLPSGAHLMVQEGDVVHPGTVLAKIPREMAKTKDIVGGLPRVVELFEARHPKTPCVITEIDGEIHYGEMIRGMRKIVVENAQPPQRIEYIMPKGVHISVLEGERVRAGDPLCDGPADPHDILRVLGIKELLRYLVNEIQEVYRLQGVQINDKHIETIVRQMIRWMKVEEVGDSRFLYGQQIDRFEFHRENQKQIDVGLQPAVGTPQVLGITKAALATDSWISAAAFQETTRVLTEASINGATDYLRGLKENVILGRLIPAGTGFYTYHDVEVDFDPTVKPREEAVRERFTEGLAPEFDARLIVEELSAGKIAAPEGDNPPDEEP